MDELLLVLTGLWFNIYPIALWLSWEKSKILEIAFGFRAPVISVFKKIKITFLSFKKLWKKI
jgi:hypothetical protein